MSDRVLFVTVTATRQIKGRFGSLGVGHLIAALEPLNLIIQAITTRDLRTFKDALDSFQPTIVCLSSVTEFWGDAILLSQLASSRQIRVIVGGHHISQLPELLPRSMSVGVVGEGDDVIVELLKGQPLQDIKGIVYWNDDVLCKTSPRFPIEDLGRLPHPMRSSNDIHVMTSRGCPFRCSFCSSAVFWNGYRCFPAEWVVEEFKRILLQNPRTRWIYVWDDLFVADRARLESIDSMIRQNGLSGRFALAVQSRAETITPSIIPLLKSLNVRAVGMGVESGNDKILRKLKGGKISVDLNDRAIKLLRQAGIQLYTSFIIGHPDETVDDLNDTINFIKTRKLRFFDVNILTPFPGTDFWTDAFAQECEWQRLRSNNLMDPLLPVSVETKRAYKELIRLKQFRKLINIWQHPLIAELLARLRGAK